MDGSLKDDEEDNFKMNAKFHAEHDDPAPAGDNVGAPGDDAAPGGHPAKGATPPGSGPSDPAADKTLYPIDQNLDVLLVPNHDGQPGGSPSMSDSSDPYLAPITHDPAGPAQPSGGAAPHDDDGGHSTINIYLPGAAPNTGAPATAPKTVPPPPSPAPTTTTAPPKPATSTPPPTTTTTTTRPATTTPQPSTTRTTNPVS